MPPAIFPVDGLPCLRGGGPSEGSDASLASIVLKQSVISFVLSLKCTLLQTECWEEMDTNSQLVE